MAIIKACLVLGITCLFVCAHARIPHEEAVFDITEYEAIADGTITDNAMPIIRTWRAACKSTGPARVVIPNGVFMASEVLFAGPCTAPAPIIVDIQGTLSANPDPSTYTNGAWLMFQSVDHVIVTGGGGGGGGTLNANGKQLWQYATSTSPLTVSILLLTVGNSQIRDLKMVDSMGFHTQVMYSHDITLTNLAINAPENSPYTDGLHMSSTTNLNFTDSAVSTGGNCVSVGQNSTNILVTRVTCGPAGHGFSIGSPGKSPDQLNVKGVTVTNCTVIGTTNGAGIKTLQNSPQLSASGIVLKDIVMKDVWNPIIT